LEDLLTYPERDRMPCLLIYGATGMGKTKIIRKFLRKHPPIFDRGAGCTSMPVVAFQMPATPDETDFYNELCRAMGSPVMQRRTASETKNAARRVLQAAGTRMLIIDEIHSMLAGTARAQQIFLNTLRFVANDFRIPLVCAGVEEARMALLTDSQLAERFDALELERWTNDGEFGRLLATVASLLPLRKESKLDSRECREIILRRTDGVTVRIFRLIESAAVQVIKDGSECITAESLSSKGLILPLVSMTPQKSEHAAAF
jgi:replication-associated recombination protein RarA